MLDPITDTFSDCVRCKEPIVTGHAYELGDGRWHIHCFSCYKCEKPLSCDSDFLVLGTGALICFDCSDSCKCCGKKIDDLAIILSSSNEAYCSECFKCCKCDNKIEDLRYAKTKRGLFCMSCHERLLEKRKRSDEKKKLLKKELPDIPNLPFENNTASTNDELIDSSGSKVESISNIPVPQRSIKRPMSPLRPDSRSSHSRSGSANIPAQVPITDFSQALHNKYSLGAEKNSEGRETTPINEHKRNVSIDHILDSTLGNDAADDSEATLKKSTLIFSKDLLNKTPLRNSSGKEHNKISPVPFDKPKLEAPVAFNTTEAIPASFNATEAIPASFNATEAILVAFNTTEAIPDVIPVFNEEPLSFKAINVTAPIHYSVDIPDVIPFSKEHIRTASSNIGTVNASINESLERTPFAANGTLKRVLSLKSKNLVSNLKSRTSSLLDTKQQSYIESEQQVQSNSAALVSPGPLGNRVSSRSQLETSPAIPFTHQRSKSGSIIIGTSSSNSKVLSSNVAIYRTPPLETSSTFNRPVSQHVSSNLQSDIGSNNEDDIILKPHSGSLGLAILNNEEKLKILLLKIRELEATKKQLTMDIESLEATKAGFSFDDDIPKSELMTSKQYNIPFQGHPSEESPIRVRNQSTASIAKASIAKPKFWKLFSGGKQINEIQPRPQISSVSLTHSNSVSTLGSVNIANRIEISKPVLQNPNEFEDVKLNPIAVNSYFENAAQNVDISKGHILIGSSLIARCLYEENKIPLLITTCIRYIESSEDHLKAEGLYRKSGSKLLIEEIEGQFAELSGSTTSKLLDLLDEDIHAVAGVLKRYLRCLPNPVITFQLYEPLMTFIRGNNLLSNLSLRDDSLFTIDNPLFNTSCKMVNKMLKHLPTEHYDLLKVVSDHVCKVSEYSEWNLMTLYNISLVFAPGLIRDFSGEKDIIDMNERNYIIGFILKNSNEVFI